MSFKSILILGLLAMVVLFSVQNAQVISVRFLHLSFDLSQALVILLSVFCGMLVGWVLGTLSRRSRAAAAAATRSVAPDSESAP